MIKGFSPQRSRIVHWSLVIIGIVFSLVSGSLSALGAVEIITDTYWTLTQSPYLIQSDVIVKSGVTLTIEPGVEVRFQKINVEEGNSNRAELIVQGKLLAQGTIDHPIRFTADSETDEMGNWAGINLLGSGSSLWHVQVDHALTGVTMTSATEIKWSRIEKNLETGILVTVSGSPTLIGNEFTYNRVGLSLSGSGMVKENRFHSNSYGLLGLSLANVTLEGNSFESNTYGIYLENSEPGNLVQENLISANDYGIYLDGGVPPLVNYNDLYNNRMYDFYHLASVNVDARYNWWGTTNSALIDAYIYDQHDNTSPIMYGYVDYSEYLQTSALAPTILSLSASPAAIKSGEMAVKIVFSKEMATQLKPEITYGLFDPYMIYSIPDTQGKWLSLTEYQCSVNISEMMSEGMYRLRIAGAESIDGQILKPNISYTFLVDRTPPTVYSETEYFTFSPNSDGRMDLLEAYVYFDEPARLTYSIYQGSTEIFGPVTEEEYLQQKQIHWDGRNNAGVLVGEGEYELHIKVRDQAANESVQPIVIPVMIDLTPPVLLVDLISGIQTETLPISGEVWDNTNPMTYFFYRQQGTVEWVSLGQLEGNLIGELYTWNLVDLFDGLYELKVRAIDLAGNEIETVQDLEVDVNAPTVELRLPKPDAHLALEVLFSGKVFDYHLSAWQLEMEVEGKWNLLATGTEVIDGEIKQLDIRSYADGEYRIRLSALDTVGRTSVLEQKIFIDNATPPEVKGINVSPAYFSPNGDGLADRLRFLINFSEIVSSEIGIFAESGEKIRTLQGTGSMLEIYWDGTKDNGTFAGDGSYTYVLTYVDQVGHLGTEKTGQVVVDTALPTLQLNPIASITNESVLTLAGIVGDFSQLLVNDKKIVVENGQFLTTVTLVEGTNLVTVVAEDQALNRAVETLTVICDTEVPVIELDPVKSLTNRSEVAVSGWIIEANLISAEVKVINALGEKISELTLDEEHFAINLPLAVGENQVTFIAVDEAGNCGEKQLRVEYVPSIPEIYLMQPVVPYVAEQNTQIVLKVLEGSVPLDPATIRIELDGVTQEYQWVPTTKQVIVNLQGLLEREYQLTAEASNTKGETGSGLQVTLVVDLTDPVLILTEPLPSAILDGWDGSVAIVGSVEDRNLQELTISLISASGVRKLLLSKDLRGESQLTGEFGVWPVSEWSNGQYSLEVVLKDLAGREAKVERNLQVHNTGMISGRVLGDLSKIDEPLLLLVQGKEIQDEIKFDELTGVFAERVAVGHYGLALAPWGYVPVEISNLQIQVGQTLSGLELLFKGEIQWNLLGGKQLIASPFMLTDTPIGAAGKTVTFNGWNGQGYYKLQDWVSLKPGRGYWVNSSETLGLRLEGMSVPRKEYRLALTKGWNLIGTPYNYQYPLDGLRFHIDGQTYTFAAGKKAGKIDAGVWKYQGWYQKGEHLEPWEGYWIYVTGAGEVIFTPEMADFPYKWSTETVQMQSVELDVVQSPEWEVQILASMGDSYDIENYFGTVRLASLGFDSGVDLREPPGFSPYVSVYFSETGAEKLTAAYQMPVQGVKGERQWQMAVESEMTGWIELKWNLEPEAILQLILIDERTGAQVNMFKESSYRFYHRGGEVREFSITASKGEFALKRLYNYANPFAATGPGQLGTRIRYLMTDDAEVEILIMDAVGRVVKRFPAMQAGKPGGQEGWNELYWNGRNSKGQPVANGAYIVKVKAYYGKKYYVKMGRMAIINGR